ncbi:hypothetical protein PC115_g20778, partial [Phytophthora cactorum]
GRSEVVCVRGEALKRGQTDEVTEFGAWITLTCQ